MKKVIFFITAVCLAMMSCKKEKTDYEAELAPEVTEHFEFKEAASANSGVYKISIEALNGTFYKGYNEIRLKITNTATKANVAATAMNFLPIMTLTDGSTISCPHRYELLPKPNENYLSGYAVFSKESTANENWQLYLNFTIANQTYSVQQIVVVKEQANKNLSMTTFTGKDEEFYVIALVSPQKPKIAENQLVAGIYKYTKPNGPPSANFPDHSQFSFIEAKDYTLQLDPRMPEPSMGNHSSPNNKDMTQQTDGLYHGVVNYTMTGNWTLNLIMLNQNGKILKGTQVSDDFTPGVPGAKSDLFIDILF